MTFASAFRRPFRPSMSTFPANGLLNGLVSCWQLESSGADSFGANTLTGTGSPSHTTGKLDNAAAFDGSTQYYSIDDNAALSAGDTNFTVSGWVNIDTLTGATLRTIAGKFTAAGNQREYILAYNNTDHTPNSRFYFSVSATGSSTTKNVDATTFGTVSAGVWYLVVGWHDADNNTVGISVNGVTDTSSHTTGVFNGSSAFAVGSRGAVLASLMDGKVDQVCFHRRILSDADINALYNNGDGLPFSQFTY